MALKSILQVPSLADRLTSVRIERFDPVGANFQNCVTSGLIPLVAYTPSLTNTDISAGKAIVGGTPFDVASITPTFTASVWNYVWVDDAGALQTGTEWPGSGNFAKVAGVLCDGSMPVRVDLGTDNRNWKLGYDPMLQALVAAPPALPGTRAALYKPTSASQQWTAIKIHQFGQFAKSVIIDRLSFTLYTLSVVGTDRAITARVGLMETDEETWVEGTYKDVPLVDGTKSYTVDLDAPWVPVLQREYVLSLELIEYGASFIASDFYPYRGSPPTRPRGFLPNSENGVSHCYHFDTSSWRWDTYRPYIEIWGYDAEGAYAQITAEELAQAPNTFQTVINKRSNDAGVYGEIDPATQIVKAEVSLDGGVHWHEFAEGEDIGTPYTGTDLIFRVAAANNNAADIEIDSVGCAYEV